MKLSIWLGLFFLCLSASAQAETRLATFAGGCFWCMESEFAEIPGISKVTSGYTGGTVKNPSYEQVSSGATGHVEAIEVVYDPAKISYEKLLDIFWQNVDPLDDYGQFCDKGSQYRAAIFTHDDEQKKLAEVSKEKIAKKFEKPVATSIRNATEFYPAEEHHQKYYQKSKLNYLLYRKGCGRDAQLEGIWKEKN